MLLIWEQKQEDGQPEDGLQSTSEPVFTGKGSFLVSTGTNALIHRWFSGFYTAMWLKEKKQKTKSLRHKT